MKEKIKENITAFKTKGTVAPSSAFLVSKMVSKIDYSKDLKILQLGFGNGVFTKEILKQMSLQSHLVIFEIDTDSRKHKIRDKRITYLEDSAENISKHFPGEEFDHVISTLPFASLPKDVTSTIFKEIKTHLKKGGTFLQFQYSLISMKALSKLFKKKPEIDFVLLNIPPAFLYKLKK